MGKTIKPVKLTADDIEPATEEMEKEREKFYEELANKINKWFKTIDVKKE